MPTPIYDHTPIDFEADSYAVYRIFKGETVLDPVPVCTGSYDKCDEYADRNDSPDNPYRYKVMVTS